MQLPISPADDLEVSRAAISIPAPLIQASSLRQKEFILGRYCAYRAILSLSGKAYNSIEIGENRAPLWPPGVVGSITHTEGFVGAAVAPDDECVGLGIDSQKWMSEETAKRVVDRIVHSEEAHLASDWEFKHQVTLIFAAKEALYKCLYPRVHEFFGFQDATLISTQRNLESQTGEFLIRVNRSLGLEPLKVLALTEFLGHYRWDALCIHVEVMVAR